MAGGPDGCGADLAGQASGDLRDGPALGPFGFVGDFRGLGSGVKGVLRFGVGFGGVNPALRVGRCRGSVEHMIGAVLGAILLSN